jgi:type II secretory pathway component PulM
MTLSRQAMQRWRDLGGRERRLIVAGLAVLLPVALYLYLWQPMTAQRERLHGQVERLRGEVASLRADAEEIARLRQQPHGGAGAETQARAAAARQGIADRLASVTAQGGDRLVVEFAAVPFASWLAWLGELGGAGLGVVACVIEPAAQAGEVRVQVTLAR